MEADRSWPSISTEDHLFSLLCSQTKSEFRMALRGVQRSRSELVIVTGSLFTRSDPIDFRNESCIAQYIRILCRWSIC